jgi:hypothetical protein
MTMWPHWGNGWKALNVTVLLAVAMTEEVVCQSIARSRSLQPARSSW